jgi:tetratricopeptide (TPR) repeat protein
MITVLLEKLLEKIIAVILDVFAKLFRNTFDRVLKRNARKYRADAGELLVIIRPRPNESEGLLEAFDALRDFAHAGEWEVVVRFGPGIIRNNNLSPLNKHRAINYVGTGCSELGFYEEAIEWFEKALEGCSDELLRRYLYVNKAKAYLLLGKYELAEDAGLRSLPEHEAFDVGLYNLLCIASVKRDKEKCKTYFNKLNRFFHSQLINPEAEWGGEKCPELMDSIEPKDEDHIPPPPKSKTLVGSTISIWLFIQAAALLLWLYSLGITAVHVID